MAVRRSYDVTCAEQGYSSTPNEGQFNNRYCIFHLIVFFILSGVVLAVCLLLWQVRTEELGQRAALKVHSPLVTTVSTPNSVDSTSPSGYPNDSLATATRTPKIGAFTKPSGSASSPGGSDELTDLVTVTPITIDPTELSESTSPPASSDNSSTIVTVTPITIHPTTLSEFTSPPASSDKTSTTVTVTPITIDPTTLSESTSPPASSDKSSTIVTVTPITIDSTTLSESTSPPASSNNSSTTVTVTPITIDPTTLSESTSPPASSDKSSTIVTVTPITIHPTTLSESTSPPASSDKSSTIVTVTPITIDSTTLSESTSPPASSDKTSTTVTVTPITIDPTTLSESTSPPASSDKTSTTVTVTPITIDSTTLSESTSPPASSDKTSIIVTVTPITIDPTTLSDSTSSPASSDNSSTIVTVTPIIIDSTTLSESTSPPASSNNSSTIVTVTPITIDPTTLSESTSLPASSDKTSTTVTVTPITIDPTTLSESTSPPASSDNSSTIVTVTPITIDPTTLSESTSPPASSDKTSTTVTVTPITIDPTTLSDSTSSPASSDNSSTIVTVTPIIIDPTTLSESTSPPASSDNSSTIVTVTPITIDPTTLSDSTSSPASSDNSSTIVTVTPIIIDPTTLSESTSPSASSDKTSTTVTVTPIIIDPTTLSDSTSSPASSDNSSTIVTVTPIIIDPTTLSESNSPPASSNNSSTIVTVTPITIDPTTLSESTSPPASSDKTSTTVTVTPITIDPTTLSDSTSSPASSDNSSTIVTVTPIIIDPTTLSESNSPPASSNNSSTTVTVTPITIDPTTLSDSTSSPASSDNSSSIVTVTPIIIDSTTLSESTSPPASSDKTSTIVSVTPITIDPTTLSESTSQPASSDKSSTIVTVMPITIDSTTLSESTSPPASSDKTSTIVTVTPIIIDSTTLSESTSPPASSDKLSDSVAALQPSPFPTVGSHEKQPKSKNRASALDLSSGRNVRSLGILTVYGLFEYDFGSDESNTPVNVQRVDRMLSYMNRSANPCGDFYEYACGGLEANHHLISENDLTDRVIQRIFDQANRMHSPESEEFLRYYDSCLNYESTMNKTERIRMAERAISRIGQLYTDEKKWPTDYKHLTDMISNLLLDNSAPLFDIIPEFAVDEIPNCANPRPENVAKFFLRLGQPVFTSSLFVKNPDECYSEQLESAKRKKVVDLDQLYEDYTSCQKNGGVFDESFEIAINAFPMFEGYKESVKSGVEQILQWSNEINLGEIREDFITKKYLTDQNDLSSLMERNKIDSFLDWTQMIKKLKGSTVKSEHRGYTYPSEEYFERFDEWIGVDKTLFNNALLGLYAYKIYHELVVPGRDENYCKRVVISLMERHASSLYMSSFSPEDLPRMEATVSRVFEDLKDTLQSGVKDAEWLNEAVKGDIINKILNLSIALPNVSYYKSGGALDPSKGGGEEILTDNFFENTMMLQRRYRKSMYQQLDESPNDNGTIWTHFAKPYHTSGSVIHGLNKIIMPYGAVDWPGVWDADRTFSPHLALATLGTSIAREIAHHFDSTGIQYSFNKKFTPNIFGCGDTEAIATNKYEAYIEWHRTMNIKRNISQSSTGETIHCKISTLSLDERISDSIGLQLAYDTMLRRWSNSANVLPGPIGEESDRKKQFFLAFTQTQCTKKPLISSFVSLREVERLPSRLRVVVAAYNNEFWGGTWNCSKGSDIRPDEFTRPFPNVNAVSHEKPTKPE